MAGFDEGLGLAVLELAQAIPEAAWPIASLTPRLGSLVMVAAYPSPEGPEVSLDSLRFAGGEGDTAYLQTDGTPFPGFSGAALLDMEGGLLGFQLSGRSGNLGWAIPASRAAELVPAIVSGKSSARAWLGIATVPISSPAEFEAAFGSDRKTALLVSGVQEGSPAAKAGIRVGDILASVGGRPLSGGEDLVDALSAATQGTELPIVILRAGTKLDLIAIPEERPVQETRQGGGSSHGWGHHPWWMGGGRCGWGRGR